MNSMLQTDNHKIIKCLDKDEFGKVAAEYFLNVFKYTEKPKIILPSGNTPLPLYKNIRENHSNLDFTYLQLDEYMGLPQTSEKLFSAWLAREILDPLEIPHSQRIFFNSAADDSHSEIQKMRNWYVEKGPADLAILGIGKRHQ